MEIKKDLKFEEAIEIIKKALEISARTLRYLPDQKKPLRYHNITPIYFEYGKMYGNIETKYQPFISSKDIDTMDMVLINWLPVLDKTSQAIVWGRANGISYKRIVKTLKKPVSTRWARHIYDKSLAKILYSLIKN